MKQIYFENVINKDLKELSICNHSNAIESSYRKHGVRLIVLDESNGKENNINTFERTFNVTVSYEHVNVCGCSYNAYIIREK